MGKYFGTDGIRGLAFEKLNNELAFKVGQAIAFVLSPQTIIIGMDTRASSVMLSQQLASGALARGVDVMIAGVTSTPMIAYYAKVKHMIGVMITASHNPYHDNGIKLFVKGYKTSEDIELLLEDFIDNGSLEITQLGHLSLTDDVTDTYLKFFETLHFHTSSLRVGYDSAHGANYQIAHTLFSKLAPHSHQISHHPDGKNINVLCGSTYPKAIIDLVQDKQLDIGFSFDGDGDRILVVDQHLQTYDGDLLIYIIAGYMKQKNLLKANTVVLTKMTNPGILKALSDIDIHYVLTDIGDKYVAQALNDHGYMIGGESSGHIILNHLLHTGDGLLVALYILHILDDLNTTIDQLAAPVELYPIKQINLKDINKSVLKNPSVIKKIEDLKDQLGQHGVLLVRPSGTEPLIRITMSHQQNDLIEILSQELVSVITKEGQNI